MGKGADMRYRVDGMPHRARKRLWSSWSPSSGKQKGASEGRESIAWRYERRREALGGPSLTKAFAQSEWDQPAKCGSGLRTAIALEIPGWAFSESASSSIKRMRVQERSSWIATLASRKTISSHAGANSGWALRISPSPEVPSTRFNQRRHWGISRCKRMVLSLAGVVRMEDKAFSASLACRKSSVSK